MLHRGIAADMQPEPDGRVRFKMSDGEHYALVLAAPNSAWTDLTLLGHSVPCSTVSTVCMRRRSRGTG